MAIPIGVTTKIERANHHIKNLETMIQAFHKTDPYSVVREEDPNTGALAFAIHFRSYPPATFSALIGDAVHNLRSSLDHLIGNLVLANNKRIGAGNEFPIFQSRESYEAKAAGKVQGVAPEAVKIIDASKPYKGGNDALWRIHQLDIIDKHRTLVTGWASLSAVGYDFAAGFRAFMPEEYGDMPPVILGLVPAVRCPLKEGDVLYRVDAESRGKVDENPQFTVDIAVNESGVLECEPIIPTLVQLVDVIEALVEEFNPFLP